MMTLGLKRSFREQARLDHVCRLKTVLCKLDKRTGFSSWKSFDQQLHQGVEHLANHGVNNPGHQACLLFLALETGRDITAWPVPDSRGSLPLEALRHSVGQAVSQGIPVEALDLLLAAFWGLSDIDQPWIEAGAGQFSLGNLLAGIPAPSATRPTQLDVCCTGAGHFEGADLSSLSPQATHFYCASGFRHRIFDEFTALRLLQHVSDPVLPTDPAIINLAPVVANCQLGVELEGCFESHQQIRLVDQRRLRMQVGNKALQCPAADVQQLRECWNGNPLFHHTHCEIAPVLAVLALQLEAGWMQQEGGFQFKAEGQITLELPGDLLDLQATLQWDHTWTDLNIRPAQGLKSSWTIHAAWPEGQLPVGQPVVVHRQSIPLLVSLSQVIRVGHSILNVSDPVAGELSLLLQARIDPDTHRFGLQLLLLHSGLQVKWHSRHLIRGVEHGTWALLEPSCLTCVELLHG